MFLRTSSLLIFLILTPIYALAAEPAVTWQAEVIEAENGDKKEDSYFNIDAVPGEQLSLDILISNKQDEPLEIEAEKANAYTASEGGIVYGKKQDGAFLLDEEAYLADFMEMDENLTVPAQSSKKLHIHVNVPNTAEGTLLGGVKLSRSDSSGDEASETQVEKGANLFSGNDQEKSIAIKISLPEASGNAGFSIGKVAYNSTDSQISVEMTNSTKEILSNVKGSYSLMDIAGNELYSGVLDPFVMAPQSKINFPIAVNPEKLADGSYTLMIKGKAGEKEFFEEETFPLTQGHSITKNEVSYSGPALGVIVKYVLWAFVTVGVILGIILIIAGNRGKSIRLGRRLNS